MNVKQKQKLKGLMYEVEIACIQYGMANEAYYDAFDGFTENEVLAKLLQAAEDKWSDASDELYDYLDTLVTK